jgi:hypothetical protein
VSAELTLTVFPPHKLFVGGEPIAGEDGKPRNFRAPCIGTRVDMSWGEFVAWTAHPAASTSKEGAGGYSIAKFRGDMRRNDACEFAYALALDFDEGDASVATIASAFRTTDIVVYSTFSSSPSSPRSRAVMRCSRPMTANEYRDVWDYASTFLRFHGLVHDKATRDPARLWYAPALRPGGHWEHAVRSGRVIDVDEAVREIARRRNEDKLARLSRMKPIAGGLERIQKYVDAIGGAVSGQHGHDATFNVACIIAGNVDDESAQMAILRSYNARCNPPWSEKELAHKLEGARKQPDLAPLEDRRRR